MAIRPTDFKSVVSTISPHPQTRRYPDSNWGIKNLQSSALPLSYTAKDNIIISEYYPIIYSNTRPTNYLEAKAGLISSSGVYLPSLLAIDFGDVNLIPF